MPKTMYVCEFCGEFASIDYESVLNHEDKCEFGLLIRKLASQGPFAIAKAFDEYPSLIDFLAEYISIYTLRKKIDDQEKADAEEEKVS